MDKKKVFVIMPFKDEFFEVYEMIKIKFADSFEFSNAGDEANLQNILKDIVQPIYEADVIIADLTGLNANVMYELGLAHSFNKKTIVITQDDLATLPFDLKQYRAKDYTTHFKKFAELLEYLERNLFGAIDNSVSYSNPVKDFLISEKIENISWFSDKPTVALEDDTDKGFIDFFADIELNTAKLTENINGISEDMQKMNAGISDSSSKIERVSKNGGNSNATFIRKETKKAAKYIDEFSLKLRERNKALSPLWDEIEKNILGLLENKFASDDDNKIHLIKYLTALHDLKTSIPISNESVVKLKESMNGTIGLERSLNQAVRFVINDLSEYINITERIVSSIDKILCKSKFVVGDIDFNNKSEDNNIE